MMENKNYTDYEIHEVVVPYKPTTSGHFLGGGLLWPTI